MKSWLLLVLITSPVGLFAQELETRKHYVAYRNTGTLIMDGKLDESDWAAAAWSELFTDIEGSKRPAPLYDTKMKMLWDDQYLYIAVWMEEPHLWATYTERESVIFHENDIEVFIDPDGDTHNYYELEINALGTEWDLLMTQPYRNAGDPINGWNINGLKKGIQLNGTLNDPRDLDDSWTVEIAIPWKALSQRGPYFVPPSNGEQWRINFSRVQWQLEIEDGRYIKKINPETGKPFPEYNWVWSPQGHINMHLPEYWGYLQFSKFPVGQEEATFSFNEDEQVKDALRKIFHLQRAYYSKNGKFASSLEELPNAEMLKKFKPSFEISATRFKISAPSLVSDQTWYITEDSRIWKN